MRQTIEQLRQELAQAQQQLIDANHQAIASQQFATEYELLQTECKTKLAEKDKLIKILKEELATMKSKVVEAEQQLAEIEATRFRKPTAAAEHTDTSSSPPQPPTVSVAPGASLVNLIPTKVSGGG